MEKITFCISTYNNLNYLILAIESVRKNSFFKTAPFIIHAENCNDGTNEWLLKNKKKYNLDIYIENNEPPIGIGGGMNFCAEKVETEYIMFLHSDFYVSENWDLYCLKEIEKYPTERVWVFSHRIEPNIFNSTERPGTLFFSKEEFGSMYFDFNREKFEVYANEFSKLNLEYKINKSEGVSGLIRKKDWDFIGGNDSIFAPTSFDDMDLFLRMKIEGYKFILVGSSVIWHFGARGSHRLEENNNNSSQRQIETEKNNIKNWELKWGAHPFNNEDDSIIHLNFKDRYNVLKMLNLHVTSNQESLISLNHVYNNINKTNQTYFELFNELGDSTYKDQKLTYHGSQILTEFICAWYYLTKEIQSIEHKNINFLEIGAYRGLWALMFYYTCIFLNKIPVYNTITWMQSDSISNNIFHIFNFIKSNGYSFNLLDMDSRLNNTLLTLRETDNNLNYDFVFIDGDHSYESVNKDIKNYFNLASNSVIFHDIMPLKKNDTCGVYEAIVDNNITLTTTYITNNEIMGIGIHSVAFNKQ